MPIERCKIRNEFRLADPGLYGVAVSDDPEALLEGVATAGLVGILRQLGDLARFAAEIFNGLHEELMATASRGKRMTVRILQVEAQLPQVEKAFITQTNRSNADSNPGTQWHPNFEICQNILSKTEAPKFISDTFEACRGLPKFHLLDKFDAAGKGACLKRYSDPSYFSTYFSFLESKVPQHQQENVAITKIKGLHSGSKENVEKKSDADVIAKSTDKDSRDVVNISRTNRIRLKRRTSHYLNRSIRMRYIECVLATDSNSISLLDDFEELQQTESIDSYSTYPDYHEVETDNESNDSVYKQIGFEYLQNGTHELMDDHEGLDKVETKPRKMYNGSTCYASSGGCEMLDADTANEITAQEMEQNEQLFTDVESNEDSYVESFISDDALDEDNHSVNSTADTELDSVSDQETRRIPGVNFEVVESREEISDEYEEMKDHDFQIQSVTESPKSFQNRELLNSDTEIEASCGLIAKTDLDGIAFTSLETWNGISQGKRFGSKNIPKYETCKARTNDVTSAKSKFRGTSWDSFMTGSSTFIDNDVAKGISKEFQKGSTGLQESEHAESNEETVNRLQGDSKLGEGILHDEIYDAEDSKVLLDDKWKSLKVLSTVNNSLNNGQYDGFNSEPNLCNPDKDDSENLQLETAPEDTSSEALDAFADLTEKTSNLPLTPRKCTKSVPVSQSSVDYVAIKKHKQASGVIVCTSHLNHESPGHDSSENQTSVTMDINGEEYNSLIINPVFWKDDKTQESSSTLEEESTLPKELPMSEGDKNRNDSIPVKAKEAADAESLLFNYLPPNKNEQSSTKQEASQKTFLHQQNQSTPTPPSQNESQNSNRNLLSHSSDTYLDASKTEIPDGETKAGNLSKPPLPNSAKPVKPPKPPSMPVSTPGAVALPGMNVLTIHGDASNMLKKVPIQTPKIEGMNMLLEEIRNQSYILKPLSTPRPYIKRPTTNLKLAAMLEKAHTLRIAVAGSDEDDDDDENDWD